MSPLKVKQPKRPPPKRTRNVGKSKRTQLTTLSSIESPPSDNGELPSTKLSPRSYDRALKDDPNMSKEQRETRGMFKNLHRALHNFARMLKKDPEHTTVETPTNMSPENKAHFLAEKKAIHLILTGIGDDIYSTVYGCQTAQEMWEAIERLQQGES
nr:hypothetical protein [Tanacetum cinerariifolium]